jgi:hypothetical protein
MDLTVAQKPAAGLRMDRLVFAYSDPRIGGRFWLVDPFKWLVIAFAQTVLRRCSCLSEHVQFRLAREAPSVLATAHPPTTNRLINEASWRGYAFAGLFVAFTNASACLRRRKRG